MAMLNHSGDRRQQGLMLEHKHKRKTICRQEAGKSKIKYLRADGEL